MLTLNSTILNQCLNEIEVKFNRSMCTNLVPNSPKSFNCTLTKTELTQGQLISGQPIRPMIQHPKLGLANLNYPLDPTEQNVVFLPSVECNQTIGRGSILGGGLLTISGSGFYPFDTDFNQVKLVNNQLCAIEFVNSDLIKCRIPAPTNSINFGSNRSVTFNVFVKSPFNNEMIPAKLDNSEQCVYFYDSNFTSIIESVEPQILSGQETIRLNITNLLMGLEKPSMINISVNNQICLINSSFITQSLIDCYLSETVSELPIVFSYLNQLRGYALMSTNFQAKVNLTISEIKPRTGSMAGGTKLTLIGSGLMDSSITVRIGSRFCKILPQIRNGTYMECLMPSIEDIAQNATSYTVTPFVRNNQNMNASSPNNFVYLRNQTPVVEFVNYSIVTNKNMTKITQINLYGLNYFDNSSFIDLIKIKIGDQKYCKLNSTQTNFIGCLIKDLFIDNYTISFYTPEFGNAISKSYLQINFDVTSISPSRGKFYTFLV